jgi:hypothetical protein
VSTALTTISGLGLYNEYRSEKNHQDFLNSYRIVYHVYEDRPSNNKLGSTEPQMLSFSQRLEAIKK